MQDWTIDCRIVRTDNINLYQHGQGMVQQFAVTEAR